MTPFTVTTQELRRFHSVDRELFGRLVVTMGCDPLEMMKIIALFMWLEAIGFPHILNTIRSFPEIVLYAFVEEALICLNFVESDVAPQTIHGTINLTQYLLRNGFSLQYLNEHRERGRTVISRYVDKFLLRAFDDIIQEASETNPTRSNQNQNLRAEITVDGNILIMENTHIKHLIMPTPVMLTQLGGGINSCQPTTPLSGGGSINSGQSFFGGESSNQAGASNVILFDGVATYNRTLFLTYEISHNITKEKLRDFFFANCGYLMEAILMEEHIPNSQFMYARVVLRSPEAVALFLNGNEVVKIVIDGQNVLVRGV